MPCTTVTVQAPSPPPPSKPTISNVVVKSRDDGKGTIDIGWNQDIAGSYTIRVDGNVATTYNGGAGYNATSLSGLTTGTHNVCVDAT